MAWLLHTIIVAAWETIVDIEYVGHFYVNLTLQSIKIHPHDQYAIRDQRQCANRTPRQQWPTAASSCAGARRGGERSSQRQRTSRPLPPDRTGARPVSAQSRSRRPSRPGRGVLCASCRSFPSTAGTRISGVLLVDQSSTETPAATRANAAPLSSTQRPFASAAAHAKQSPLPSSLPNRSKTARSRY